MRCLSANESGRRRSLLDRVGHNQTASLDMFSLRNDTGAQLLLRCRVADRLIDVGNRIDVMAINSPDSIAWLQVQLLKGAIECYGIKQNAAAAREVVNAVERAGHARQDNDRCQYDGGFSGDDCLGEIEQE